MQTDKPRYAINLKDERIVYRSKATDEMRALYRWIPNDVAKAIMDGKLEAKKVVNVITKKMFSDENFDHSEYEAELRKLNVVFKEEEVPEPEEVVDTTADDVADSVTMEELMGGAPAPTAEATGDGDEPAPPPKKPAGGRRQSRKTEKPPVEPPADNGDGDGDGDEPAPAAEEATPDEENLDI